MVGSLLRRSKFYWTDCLSEPPTLSFKEPHMATTLRLCSCYGLTPCRIGEDCNSLFVISATVCCGLRPQQELPLWGNVLSIPGLNAGAFRTRG